MLMTRENLKMKRDPELTLTSKITRDSKSTANTKMNKQMPTHHQLISIT